MAPPPQLFEPLQQKLTLGGPVQSPRLRRALMFAFVTLACAETRTAETRSAKASTATPKAQEPLPAPATSAIRQTGDPRSAAERTRDSVLIALGNRAAAGDSVAVDTLMRELPFLDGGALEDALVAGGAFFDRRPATFARLVRAHDVRAHNVESMLQTLGERYVDQLQAQATALCRRLAIVEGDTSLSLQSHASALRASVASIRSVAPIEGQPNEGWC